MSTILGRIDDHLTEAEAAAPAGLRAALENLRRSWEGRCINTRCPSEHEGNASDCIEAALVAVERVALAESEPDPIEQDYIERAKIDGSYVPDILAAAPAGPDVDARLVAWAGCVQRLIAVAPVEAVVNETGIDMTGHATPPERKALRAKARAVVDGWLARDRAALEALDVNRLAVAMNAAQITAREISLGRDLSVPAGRIAKAYGDALAGTEPGLDELRRSSR